MRTKIFLYILSLISYCSFGQIEAYPTHWWVGMKNRSLQLLIRGAENISSDKLNFVSSSPDVKVIKIHKQENPHYLIIDLEIAAAARPQQVKFSFGGIIK